MIDVNDTELPTPLIDDTGDIIEVNHLHDGADEIKIKSPGKRTITRYRDKSSPDDEGLLSKQEARRRGITLSTLPQASEISKPVKTTRKKTTKKKI